MLTSQDSTSSLLRSVWLGRFHVGAGGDDLPGCAHPGQRARGGYRTALGVSRLLAFPAPFIGSLLFERGGLQLPVIVTLAGIIVVMLGIIVLVKEPRPAKIGTRALLPFRPS